MIRTEASLHVYGKEFRGDDVVLGKDLERRVSRARKLPDVLPNQTFILPKEDEYEYPERELLKRFEPYLSKFRAVGAEEFSLYISVGYGYQCNWEIHPESLSILASMGAVLALSCWKDDEIEEMERKMNEEYQSDDDD